MLTGSDQDLEEEELDRRNADLIAELRSRPFPPWHAACEPEEAASLSALALSVRSRPLLLLPLL